jgi:hypothetical protein
VEFSQQLRADVLSGQITVSFRLWRRPKVRAGGRYRVNGGLIEVDSIDVIAFSSIDRTTCDYRAKQTSSPFANEPPTPAPSTMTPSSTESSSTSLGRQLSTDRRVDRTFLGGALAKLQSQHLRDNLARVSTGQRGWSQTELSCESEPNGGQRWQNSALMYS